MAVDHNSNFEWFMPQKKKVKILKTEPLYWNNAIINKVSFQIYNEYFKKKKKNSSLIILGFILEIFLKNVPKKNKAI